MTTNTTATSAVRAMIANWSGSAFSEMQDAYRPPDRKNPRWFQWDKHSLRIRYPRPNSTPVPRENDFPPPGWRETATAIWVALPANDSDIFPRVARTESPKHATLAARCTPTLAWREARKPREPLSTNWLLPDNDNEDGDEPGRNPDRTHNAGPSPDALVVAYKKGKLRFSNGEHREKCYVLKNDKAVRGDVLMPAGALLNYPDKPGELLGPEPNPEAMVRTATYWASMFKVDRDTVVETDEDGNEKPRFIPAGRRKKRKVLITREEQQELMASAPRPAVTYCKPGLPCGSDTVGDSFVGMHITSTKGRQPPERWQDTADELARQAEFEAWCKALPPEQQKALDIATTAANFREVGEAFGHEGKTAERQGKKLLLAANDNSAEILKKVA
ncbi:hypothetical protein [Mesorhizobium sp. M7A.F.Ca.ET.027.03.2.1]|uniref:hypothetical protein n=1 Tax=Mesorhizobium sp. M7A.F.Ca.ET.027.03.2.1 TaxID=2496656 RepID=UPI000FCB6B0C|nr:hypothetical protein [Mesorhizobium sp. M7A.F.Ca.ET.027.03.2.1]RVD62928.1 hypothetical protein EN750_19435 [Mesorhizobium sp. M7A.F.Ca.ET.027.03.2.1]